MLRLWELCLDTPLPPTNLQFTVFFLSLPLPVSISVHGCSCFKNSCYIHINSLSILQTWLYFHRIPYLSYWHQKSNTKLYLECRKESCDKARQHIKKQRHHFAHKIPYSQGYDFSSSHGQMWELDHKVGWVQKNWSFQTVILEKTLESSMDCKEITPVSPKEINPKYSCEGLFLKLKLKNFDHLKWRASSLEKTLMLEMNEGKRWERRRMRLVSITDSMDMYLSKLQEDNGSQRSLVCCSPWGHKEQDTT